MVDWGYTDEKKGHPVTATEASLLRITKKFPKQKVSRDSQTCKIASFIVILSVRVNNRRTGFIQKIATLFARTFQGPH